MCKNATATAASLMAAIEPTLVSLLTLLGIATTPEGQAAIAAYEAAQKAVAAWVPGTTAVDVVQVVNAFVQVFDTLPIPADAKILANIISAGIVTVIGVLTANSPAPAGSSTHDEIQAAHAADVIAKTTTKVQTMVPGFKQSVFSSAANQYDKAWNKGVDKAGPKYAGLKV